MTLALYGKSRRRQWMLVALGLVALLGAFSAAFALRESARAESGAGVFQENQAKLLPISPTNPDFLDASDCDRGPYADEDWVWHFVTQGQGTFLTLSATFASGPAADVTIVSSGPNAGKHAYVKAPDGSNLVSVSATTDPAGTVFVLSHTCAGTTPTPTIDIDKSNNTGDNIVDPGESFNWIIKVTVSGAATSAATSITDTIPADFTAGAPVETSDQLDCSASSGNNINCTLASGAPVGEYTITVPVTVSSEPEICGEPITNTAVAQMGTEPAIDDDDSVTINCNETPTRVLEVCKHVESDSAGGGVFTIQVEGQSNFVTDNLGPGDDDCETYTVLDGAEVTITETGFPAGWNSASGYPTVSANGNNIPGGTITVTVGAETCEEESQEIPTFVDSFALHSDAIADCTVVFYNKSEGQVSPTGDLRIEKYRDINGDGDANDPGEGPIAGWSITVNGPDVNGPFVTDANGVRSFSGLDTGDSYTVTENLPAGWNLTNVKVDGSNSAVTVSKTVTIPNGQTRVVAFYNQPLGSLNVNKVAVTSHNGGPDVPSPQDRDGWTITVSSAQCGINQSKQTDANGNASFANLPLCTDYVVSENTTNPQSPNFVPVGPSSVSNVTPNGQTITFTNRRTTIDILIITPTPEIPTPTFTPTATPTNPPTNTPTATPTPLEETRGERTPGPTPIAPSTGTGGSGGAAGMNLLLLIAGLAALSGGFTLAVAGKRRR